MPEGDEAAKRKALVERASRLYEAEREMLIKHGFEVGRDFDKWALTAAGAALGISFTFLKDLVPLPAARAVWLAGIGWLCLVLAVVVLLSGLKCGYFAHERFRDCLDRAAQDGLDAETFKRARESQAKCRSADFVTWFRWSGLGLTLLGLLFLLGFVLFNVERLPNGQRHDTAATASATPSASASASATTATATASGPSGTARATVGAPDNNR